MNPQERQLVDELFERLSKLESAPRDAKPQAPKRVAKPVDQGTLF